MEVNKKCLLNEFKYTFFFCKNKPYKNNEAEVYKKEERIKNILRLGSSKTKD